MRFFVSTPLIVVALMALASCSRSTVGKPQDSPARPTIDNWVGIYSSPIEGFSGSGVVLSLTRPQHAVGGPALDYCNLFRMGPVGADRVIPDQTAGTCLFDGWKLYVPRPSGTYWHGKLELEGDIDRYTMVNINGQTVLLSDEELERWQKGNAILGDGLLIKVSDEAPRGANLDSAKHRSIRSLLPIPSKRAPGTPVHLQG